MKKATSNFSLREGKIATINAAVVSASACVDFGLISPHRSFHYVSVLSGTINVTIKIEQRESYTFAVRNKSDDDVSTTGYANY